MNPTPKETAQNLESMIYDCFGGSNDLDFSRQAKRCLHFIVDQIIEAEPTEPAQVQYYETVADKMENVFEYWTEVKKEIDLL